MHRCSKRHLLLTFPSTVQTLDFEDGGFVSTVLLLTFIRTMQQLYV